MVNTEEIKQPAPTKQAKFIKLKTTERITKLHENVNKFMFLPLMDMFRSDMNNRIALFCSKNNDRFPTDTEFHILLIQQFNQMDIDRKNEDSPWSDYTNTARTKVQEFVYTNGPKVISRICLEFDIEEWEEATSTSKKRNNETDNTTAKKAKA